eukprot:3679385-Ditylum_brightwellii.AAC.1
MQPPQMIPQFQQYQPMAQQPFTNMTNQQYQMNQQYQLFQANNKCCQKKRGKHQQQQNQNSGQQNQVNNQQQQGKNHQRNLFIHKYCWMYGGCNHWRPECCIPAQGHQQVTNFQNKLGGSIKN